MSRKEPGYREDDRYFEAILCALLIRAGGAITLPAAEVADGGNHYDLYVRADGADQAVVLEVRPVAEMQ